MHLIASETHQVSEALGVLALKALCPTVQSGASPIRLGAGASPIRLGAGGAQLRAHQLAWQPVAARRRLPHVPVHHPLPQLLLQLLRRQAVARLCAATSSVRATARLRLVGGLGLRRPGTQTSPQRALRCWRAWQASTRPQLCRLVPCHMAALALSPGAPQTSSPEAGVAVRSGSGSWLSARLQHSRVAIIHRDPVGCNKWSRAAVFPAS